MKSKAYYKPVLASKDGKYYDQDVVIIEELSYLRYLWEKEEHHSNSPSYFNRKDPFNTGERWVSGDVTGDVYLPYPLTLKRNDSKRITIDSVYIKGHTTFTDTLFY